MTMQEIDALVLKLVTRERFVETFWHELAEERREHPTVKRREVFDRLNDLYENAFGRPQFPSWEAFKKFINRK